MNFVSIEMSPPTNFVWAFAIVATMQSTKTNNVYSFFIFVWCKMVWMSIIGRKYKTF